MESKQKHAGGRPSKYDPKYCDLVRELGKTGGLTCTFASTIGVDKDTINQWGKIHAEFSEALKDAKSSSESYMMKLAMMKCDGTNEKGSDNMIKFLLSAAHGYREKTDTTSSVDMNVKGSIELDFGER
jgi:hypothetical protein